MIPPDPLSDFVQASHKEKERASVDIRTEVGDTGFHLRAKGGKRAIEKLMAELNEVL